MRHWLGRAVALAATSAVGMIAARLTEHVGARIPYGPEANRRGRHARHPLAMTRAGWRDIMARMWHEVMVERLFSNAAGVAFFLLLAFVPALSVLVSIYGMFSDPVSISDQLGPFVDVLPAAAQELVVEQARRLAAQPRAELSVNLLVSLAIAIWSANAGMKSLFDALNVIYEEDEKRSFLMFNAVATAGTVTALIVFVLFLLALAVVPAWLDTLPYGNRLATIVAYARLPVFYAVAVAAIALLYWLGPSRRAARFVWVLPGAAIAALAWVGASSLFTWYATSLGNYTATYGSLAAVVIFMTWLWLSASILLIGASLNAELEHQTARDTTIGRPRPMGARGAVVADTLGEPSL